jgi:hypothetical protein
VLLAPLAIRNATHIIDTAVRRNGHPGFIEKASRKLPIARSGGNPVGVLKLVILVADEGPFWKHCKNNNGKVRWYG